MLSIIQRWFNRPCPQNFIIKNPYAGTLILAVFTFLFLVLYRPLGTHAGRYFSYEITMGLYILIASTTVLATLLFLKSRSFFSDQKQWTIKKELLVIFISLLSIGIAGYFAAFIMEEPAQRWNWPTFFDSVLVAFLIGLMPFLFFTTMNLRYWFFEEQPLVHQQGTVDAGIVKEPVKIGSQLKKEELVFLPHQFVYAESEGNYVNFYIDLDGKLHKKVIRNSISNVEQQLIHIPFICRTHRAFIVNLNKVISKKGNALGYRIRLPGVEQEIPVARNNTREFNLRLRQQTQS